MRLLISLATYNEIENLPVITEEIFSVVPDADILIIDDNSPDGTGNWVSEKMKSENRLKYIPRSGKLGLGTATIEAMKYAVENGYDYLLNMDADLSHQPRYIPVIYRKAEEGFDVVIGSRYVSGGGTENWSFTRRLMSRCINLYARILLGLKTQDNSGAFRCYKTEALKKIDFGKIMSNGYSFCEEVLFHLKKTGASFAEVPIIFIDRRFGSSKINYKETLNALWILLRLGIFGR
ncbi:dolichol-phosphate mannosyltransferase [Planctomycetales bacterium]|nr:dolichol-phosphate mannosyltransferase [Planctomycetales bacterium]